MICIAAMIVPYLTCIPTRWQHSDVTKTLRLSVVRPIISWLIRTDRLWDVWLPSLIVVPMSGGIAGKCALAGSILLMIQKCLKLC